MAPGEVAEWLNAPHSKCGIGASLSGVRIPPSPPRHSTFSPQAPPNRSPTISLGVLVIHCRLRFYAPDCGDVYAYFNCLGALLRFGWMRVDGSQGAARANGCRPWNKALPTAKPSGRKLQNKPSKEIAAILRQRSHCGSLTLTLTSLTKFGLIAVLSPSA